MRALLKGSTTGLVGPASSNTMIREAFLPLTITPRYADGKRKRLRRDETARRRRSKMKKDSWMTDIPLEANLSDFSGVCRLFPLGEFVLLPHAVAPLHVFEPRYRQMTEHALASDRLITIVQSRPAAAEPGATFVEPRIEKIGCVGRIIRVERTADGRFNFLLLGCRRVRLTRELRCEEILYRLAEGELIVEVDPPTPLDEEREELIDLFRRFAQENLGLDPAFDNMLAARPALGPLTDLIGHALPLPWSLKQSLLADPNVQSRLEALLAILRSLNSRQAVSAGIQR